MEPFLVPWYIASHIFCWFFFCHNLGRTAADITLLYNFISSLFITDILLTKINRFTFNNHLWWFLFFPQCCHLILNIIVLVWFIYCNITYIFGVGISKFSLFNVFWICKFSVCIYSDIPSGDDFIISPSFYEALEIPPGLLWVVLFTFSTIYGNIYFHNNWGMRSILFGVINVAVYIDIKTFLFSWRFDVRTVVLGTS